MCFPLAAAAITAAGTLFSAATAAAGYSAQAKFADRQAIIEDQKGAYEAQRMDDATTRQIARMRSGYMASGIDLSGSATDVISDSAAEASLDSQAIRYGAKIKKDNYKFEGGMARMNAGNAIIGGAIGAIAPFVNAAAQNQTASANRTMISNPYRDRFAMLPPGLY